MITIGIVCLIIFLIAVSLIPTAKDRARSEFWENRQKQLPPRDKPE